MNFLMFDLNVWYVPLVFNSLVSTLISIDGSSKRIVFSYIFILGGSGVEIARSFSLKRLAIGLGAFLSFICLKRHKSLVLYMSVMLSSLSFFSRGLVCAFVPDPVRALIAFFVV